MDFSNKFLSRWSKLKSDFPKEIPSLTQIYDQFGEILSEQFNSVELELNATSHSEILAIEKSLRIRNEKYLVDCTLITALEPCLQCAGSIIRVKIPKVIYFLSARSGEGISSYSTETLYLLNHFPKLEYIENSLIKAEFGHFFKEKR